MYQSPHFELQQLGPGVFAAIHREGGQAISNAGIIDLGKQTLIFDTMMTPRAAGDLKLTAETLFGRPVAFVVNSHFHNDHIWGNQLFPGATRIIASSITRQLIESKGMDEFTFFNNNSQKLVDALDARYAMTDDQSQREELLRDLRYHRAIIEALPTLRIRLPDITFSDRLDLVGSNRSVELVTLGGGHTGSDVFMRVPDANIFFMGDLLFIDHHPDLSDGDPAQLVSILDQILQMNPGQLVPGHGPVGDARDITLLQEYVRVLTEQAAWLASNGSPPDSVSARDLPEPFSDWRLTQFLHSNLAHLRPQPPAPPDAEEPVLE